MNKMFANVLLNILQIKSFFVNFVAVFQKNKVKC
jgi:hypothetical protein